MTHLTKYALMAGTVFLLFFSLPTYPAAANGARLCKSEEAPCSFFYPTGTEIKMSLKPGTVLEKAIRQPSKTNAKAGPWGVNRQIPAANRLPLKSALARSPTEAAAVRSLS